jgi:5-methylcytosine-specific restriction endonuclease McrA
MRIDCAGRIEVAHVRSAANSGTGLKPADWWAVPLCQTCHRLQHEIGIATFEKQMQVDLAALAREFAKRSPDQAMRKAMKESEEWTGIPNLR